MNTLIYVDKELAIAIAAKLVDIMLQSKHRSSSSATLNWLIQSNLAVSEHSIGKDIRMMLPEDIVYLFYDNIPNKFQDVSSAIKALAISSDDKLLPGAVVSICGNLSFPDVSVSNYDPFSPPDIAIPLFSIHSEKCFVGKLTSDSFILPLYFPEMAKNQVCFCDLEPVEIIGVVRWSPPYRPKGATSLNKIIRVGVVLLR